VQDGSAVRKFQDIIRAQHGDPRAIEDYALLPQARATADVVAPQDGFVTAIDTEGVGRAGVVLGAGRERTDARIDPAVGFTILKKVGERVAKGEPLVRVHYNTDARLDDVKARLAACWRVGPEAPAARPLVLERLE
jgi:pyrimidine-nucleoside phosphorylase